MNFIKLPLILALLFLPSQDRSPLAVGPELDGDPAIHPMEQNTKAHGQQMNIQSQPGHRFLDSGKLKIELSLDGFGVKPWLGQAVVSFSVVYQFEIGEDCHPTHICLFAGEMFIDGKAASESLAKWVFAGLEKGKKYVLVVNWESMKGYASMSLLSDQMSLSVRLQKDRPVP